MLVQRLPRPLSTTPSWVACMSAKSLQLCPTLCDAMECSPPGSSIYGILQARILHWVAMPSSGGSSPPRGCTLLLCLLHWHLPLAPSGKSWAISTLHKTPSQEGQQRVKSRQQSRANVLSYPRAVFQQKAASLPFSSGQKSHKDRKSWGSLGVIQPEMVPFPNSALPKSYEGITLINPTV